MTMRDLANATGGHAYMNTNDLASVVKDVVQGGASFYTLAYVPSDTNSDGKLRRIKVRTSMHGASLEYRQAYYASMPEQKTPNSLLAVNTPDGGGAAERAAMTLGSPNPTEILVRVGVIPVSAQPEREQTVAPANHPSNKMHGPYRRYSVNFEINARDLTFVRAEGGMIRSDFDLLVFVYGRDGSRLNALETKGQVSGDIQEIRKKLAEGIFAHDEISVPATGDYFIRAVVRDETRNRFGGVEVSTAQVRNLPPPAHAASQPAAK